MKIEKLALFCVIVAFTWACGSGKKEARLSRKAPVPKTAVSQEKKVDQVIQLARQHYFQGERELNLGHLDKARLSFDACLDTLMHYQSANQPDSKIEALIDEYQEKIYQHEMAALREGDGFTERSLEPALIDDLKNITTFPPPDQETKQHVQRDVQKTAYDIPVEINDQVLSFIRIFQNGRRKEFVGGLVRSGRYLNMMKRIFREEGLPEDLVYTALIESSFKSNAYSRARAKGFWQFIAGTAQRYNLRMDWWVDERSDFEKSTRAAARYLKDLHGMFGDWYLALAGYNAGENKILRGVQQIGSYNFWQLARTNYIRTETKNYVPAILAGMIIAKDPAAYGFFEHIEQPLQFEKVRIDYAVDLRLVAECTGASLEEIRLLNPELNRSTTPYRNGSYDLRLPRATKETFLAEISAVPEEKRLTWRKHEVRPGDSLTSIASQYRTSVTSIAAVNSFPAGSPLAPGQKIVIPIGRSPVTYSKTTYTSVPAGSRVSKYTVRRGDTLFRIATKFGTSVDRLRAWNGFSTKHILRPGQSLIVRVSTTKMASAGSSKKIIYRVKTGDTLFQIANNYNIDVNSIKKWNNLNGNVAIYPGDRLTIYANK